MIQPKQVYYLETLLSGRPGHTRSHYTVVVFVEDDRALLVPICSKRPHAYDPTVELGPNEYPRLRHASFVEYSKADFISLGHLSEQIAAGLARPCETLNAQVFLRIKNGLLNSTYTKRKIKNWVKGRAAE